MLDPNDKKYDTGGGGDYKDLKTPGTYLLGCRKVISHGKTQNDKAFTRFAFVVIAGPRRDESFVDRVFRSPSSYKRLAMVCRAMRITEPWDPSKTVEVERVMLGRAFKSSVEINDGGYAELKFPQTEFTENELAAMTTWEQQFKRTMAKKIDDPIEPDDFKDDPGPGDDFVGGFGKGGPDDFGGNDFGDDDIPF